MPHSRSGEQAEWCSTMTHTALAPYSPLRPTCHRFKDLAHQSTGIAPCSLLRAILAGKFPESQGFTLQLLVFCGTQGHRSLPSGNTPTNNPAVTQRQERQGLGAGLSHALPGCSAGKIARFLLLIKSNSSCLCPCPQGGTQAIVCTY